MAEPTQHDGPPVSVTILVPTYNRPTYLAEAIASLVAQTLAAERILVIDDGSTEDIRPAIARFGRRVDYLRKENGGKASALNVGLAECRSEFVWIFDDDDIAAPDALQRLAAPLLEAPELGFSFGAYDVFRDGADGRRFADTSFPDIPPDEIFLSLLGRFLIHHPGLLVRRACYAAVGGFDEGLRFSEDFEMQLRLARHFRGVQVGGGPLFSQRDHEGPRGGGQGDREKNWKPFNQGILRRLRECCALEDFLPRGVAGGSHQDRFSALLQRATAMGRRGVWDEAGDDMELAAALANAAAIQRLTSRQAGILRGLFDPWSEGAPEFPQAAGFRRALGLFASKRLAHDIRLNASWGLPYLARQAWRREGAAGAARHARSYMQIASPLVLAMTVLGKATQKLSRSVG